MNAFALHAPTARTRWRWAGSALTIVAIHVGLIAGGIAWYRDNQNPGVAIPTILIDMAPATASPDTPQQAAPPGPAMVESDVASEPPPEQPPQQQFEEPIPSTPVMEKPVVEAPPEQKVEPSPPPPEPAKVTPQPAKSVPVKPKPVRNEVKKKPSETKPAPRTTAPERAENVAPAASAIVAGASRAVAASYNQTVQAHVKRFMQYPSSRSGPTGKAVAMAFFTLDRSGRLVSSHLKSSSGQAELDADALATIRRAQPFPAFPAEMREGSKSFTVPMSYLLR